MDQAQSQEQELEEEEEKEYCVQQDGHKQLIRKDLKNSLGDLMNGGQIDTLQEMLDRAEQNQDLLFFVDNKQQTWQIVKRSELSLADSDEDYNDYPNNYNGLYADDEEEEEGEGQGENVQVKKHIKISPHIQDINLNQDKAVSNFPSKPFKPSDEIGAKKNKKITDLKAEEFADPQELAERLSVVRISRFEEEEKVQKAEYDSEGENEDINQFEL
jgi:hypothetical protein